MRYFTAIVETGSFRKAAERLHVSQPPLSQQIRDLEYELGADLFIRHKRSISLTREGKAFYERAVKTLDDVTDTQKQIAALQKGYTGELNIHFMSSASAGILQRLIAPFKTEYPDIALKLSQSTVTQIIDDILAGRIDLGFVRTPVQVPAEIEKIQLMRESYYIALPSGHDLADKTVIDLNELSDEGLIIYPRHTAQGSFDDVIALHTAHGVSPSIVIQAPEQLTIAGLVAAGLGYSVVPECMCDVTVPGVIHRPVKGGERRSGVALLAKDMHNPAIINFLSMLNGNDQNTAP